MNITELKSKIIEEGIKSVLAEKQESHRIGGKKGFERCRELETMEDFEQELIGRHFEEFTAADKYHAGEITIDKYWEYRYATVQIEYCYEILKVAFRYPVISCNAALRYSELVGTII